MRLVYVILSPALGMQLYTADLAQHRDGTRHVIAPRLMDDGRYASPVCLHATARVRGTGLQPGNLRLDKLHEVYHATRACAPDLVHFTGPHIWNPVLLLLLRRAGIPTVHTIHDLDPHTGTGYGRLLYAWNAAVLRCADHILVHGQVYRERLIRQGQPPERVTYAPLLHLCVGYAAEQRLRARAQPPAADPPFALFFGRFEAYNGVDVLFEAMRRAPAARAVIAGEGVLALLPPPNVELRNRLIADDEAVDLFDRCSLVVLPYRDATQSALIAAAYFFHKPVIVTRAGALPEYVVDGETGWVIPPGDPQALADRLSAALGDPLRLARMGAAGRAWYEQWRVREQAILQAMYARVAATRNQ